jgi:hypothetical protein
MISVALNRPRTTRLIAGDSDAVIALSDTLDVTAVPEYHRARRKDSLAAAATVLG